MRLSYTIGAFICTFAIAIFSVPNLVTPSTNAEGESTYIDMNENAIPAQFVYIRFSGENSQMVQLKDVEGVLSERLSEYSVE